MDFKKYLPVMLLGLMLVIGWPLLMDRIAKHYNWSSKAVLKEAPAQPLTDDSVVPVASTQVTTRWTAVSAPGETNSTTIGSVVPRNPQYSIGLTLNSSGAGIDSVVLNQFKQKLNSDDPFKFGAPYENFEANTRMLATRGLVIDGEWVDLSKAVWTLVADPSADPQSQRSTWSLTLADNGTPAIEVRKTFEVFEKDAKHLQLPNGKPGDGPEGYESIVRHTFINKTDRPLSIALVVNGPHPPPPETERDGPGTFQTGFVNDRGIVLVESHNAASIKAEAKDLFHNDSATKKPVYVGTVSNYFATVVRPVTDPTVSPSQYLASANAMAINPDAKNPLHPVDLAIQTKPFALSAGAQTFFDFAVYLGPKKREIMGNDYYKSFGVNEVMVVDQGICGSCTFDWLIQILFVILRAFHAVVKDWGLSIIMLVLLVRLMLHPVTKFSQLNMLKLTKFGPELKKLQEKYKDDKEGYARAQMQMMKQQGAGPFMGCLPMLMQTPIWIAMWQAMQTTFELRHAPFLYGFTWIHDLSKPDHLIDFTAMGMKPISIFGLIVISGLNILPVLLAIVFYIQTRITPQPQAATPEQEQQQKMMKWMMVFMFPLLLYSQPSGLCLYTLTSTCVGIIESRLIRKKFDRAEALAAKFRLEEGDVQKVVAKKKTGLGLWMEQKMAQIDAIQKAAQQQQKPGQDRKKKRD
ncbi:MAG TPA: membrane protein insertase YidC [Tepidisphaeraceae bacterium]|nr:membrane protein insertase YidC [Tepidisphaeraceae bacterium]